MPLGQLAHVPRPRRWLRLAATALALALTFPLLSAAPAPAGPAGSAESPPTPTKVSPPTPTPPPAPAADDKPLVRLVEHFLAGGQQSQAEWLLTKAVAFNPQSTRLLFWRAVCMRSRFDSNKAAVEFGHVLRLAAPKSPEALAADCIIGIDFAPDWSTRLEFYQKLNALSTRYPDDHAILWLTAISARTVTLDKNLPAYLHQPILNQGIAHYQTLLAHWSPGLGPVLVHQTFANLLYDRSDYQLSLRHHKLAAEMEPFAWSLQAYAEDLTALCRYREAIAPASRAVALAPRQNTLFTLGAALWMSDRRDEALVAWNKEAPHDPLRTLLYHGRLALGDDRWDQAWQYFLMASAIGYPPDASATIYLARTAIHLHQPGACAAMLTTDTFDYLGDPVHDEPPTDPWRRAAKTGDLTTFRRLAQTGDIDRREKDAFNTTALMTVAQYGWGELIPVLVNRHARLDLQDDNGDTALHYAASFEQPDSVRRLLAAGANPNLRDRWGQTPLIQAVGTDDFDAVSALVARGADLSIATHHGGTALDYAVGRHDRDSLLLLLAHGANPNALTPSTGETPLMTLNWGQQNYSFLQPLLAAGADIRLKDKHDLTALHHAIIPDLNHDFVNALLDAGADPHARSAAGLTPITLARALGYEELAAAMETRSGRPEAFQLPALPPLNPGETPACAAYTLPIRLACGQPCDLLDSDRTPDRSFARAELKNTFGLENHDALKTDIDQLNRNTRADTPVHPADWELPAFEGKLVDYTEAVFVAPDKWTAPGCAAWSQSHRIYLAELGRLAGYLTPAESDAVISDASLQISQHTHDWNQFSKSFLAGAARFEGWNRTRYGHICDRLLSGPWAALPWPKTDAKDNSTPSYGESFGEPVANLGPGRPAPTSLLE